jgi:hypothetical protein
MLSAYRQVWPAFRRQLRYEDYFLKRTLPPTAKPYREDLHRLSPGTPVDPASPPHALPAE